MDSGCSFHICSHRSWFEDIDEHEGSLLLGNDQVCKVKGIGKIRLRLADGSVKVLTEVRFIPQIKRNLISLGMLESKGYGYSSVLGFSRSQKMRRPSLRQKERICSITCRQKQ